MDRSLESELSSELEELKRKGQRRELALLGSGEGIADFTSNDYLGLARHPRVIAAGQNAIEQYGVSARASRLLGGGCPLDAQVESALADWIQAESALLFPTGYQANLGLITTLAGAGDTIFSDERMHASMVDACRLSKARTLVFPHNDVQALDELLNKAPKTGRRLVLTEGVFSMGGDRAPLAELQVLCAKQEAWLIVDEAHSIGILGDQGAGAWIDECERLNGDSRVLARVITGGKALGASGGLVAGSSMLRELLLQRARSFIFTTGGSPANSGALRESIELARGADEERARLHKLGEALAQRLDLRHPPAAILPFPVGSNEAALRLAQRAIQAGLEVRAVRPPTVPAADAGLRIVLHASNTQAELERLGDFLATAERATPAAPSIETGKTPVFITGTDTGIGKTVVSAILARERSRLGPTTYWKPVQTGDDSDTQTLRELGAGCAIEFGVPTYAFPLPASPHEAAAEAKASVDAQRLQTDFEQQRRTSPDGQLLVELAGGLLVPYDDRRTQIDWLAEVRPRIVLVARSGLGTLNHTLLSVEALRARKLEVETLFLVGDPHPSNCETLTRMTGIERVFQVPLFDPLCGKALDGWIDENSPLISNTTTR